MGQKEISKKTLVSLNEIKKSIGTIIVFFYSHLDPGGMGGIWVCGVEAGVGGLRSPPSAIELLVDCGVWGPCKEPDPAVELRDA